VTQPTPYPAVNDLLDSILSQLRIVLPTKLVGMYLYGSLVTGDFDTDASDVDLMAAVASDLDDVEFAAINEAHARLIATYPIWENRLEIGYLSLQALQNFKTVTSQIAIISPGEPFHWKDAGRDWLLNWYIVREHGLALYGPPPTAIIVTISKAEYIQAVRDQVEEWGDYIDHVQSRPYQGYVILTMCRALYAIRTGSYTSKKQAAQWAAHELPEWSTLINTALLWRQSWRDDVADPEATLAETRRFVFFIIDLARG
jgi:hypothetical protein